VRAPTDEDRDEPAASEAAPLATQYRLGTWEMPLAPVTTHAPLPSKALPLQKRAVSAAPPPPGVQGAVADTHAVPFGQDENPAEPSEY
jgi:hypothetical protein